MESPTRRNTRRDRNCSNGSRAVNSKKSTACPAAHPRSAFHALARENRWRAASCPSSCRSGLLDLRAAGKALWAALRTTCQTAHRRRRCVHRFVPCQGTDVILGDVHDPGSSRTRTARSRVRDEGPPPPLRFCICSHLLEGVRDPIFVRGQLARTFRHRYIAMPNKHVEFSHCQSKRYLGYCHHRWIFTLTDWSCGLSPNARLPWWNRQAGPTDSPLFGGELRFCILNDDFAGRTR
jgi:hypothetical protein